MHNGFLIAKVGELQRSDANWVLSEKDGFGHTQRRHFRPFLLHAEIRSHRNPKNGFLFVKTGSLSKNLARMGSICKFLVERDSCLIAAPISPKIASSATSATARALAHGIM